MTKVGFFVIAFILILGPGTKVSYANQYEKNSRIFIAETPDTTKRIVLETTHLENIFLEGQEVCLKVKYKSFIYKDLKLSLYIKQKSGDGKATFQKKVSNINLKNELDYKNNKDLKVNGLAVGTYLVEYTFKDERKIVSSGVFELKVLPEFNLGREEQLESLRTKSILVPTWGWPYNEMCDEAKKFGYNVFNAPWANRIDPEETSYYFKNGVQIIARPSINVKDPFDPEDVKAGCRQLAEIVDFYGSNPGVLGFSIAYGLYGEGGFEVPPYGKYEFSEKARKGFNDLMNTPNAPLPLVDTSGLPGNMRYIKWIEYRQQTLTNFRKEYISEMKKVTKKLVGTWSEVYPLVNYTLNMGDAPGADFMFYDLSFGDVSFNQKIAFAETHGDMQHFPSFDLWKKHIMPLVAKAYGEGVIPMGFQFPMRRGHSENFLATTKYFTDRIEDEYALKINPEYQKIMQNKVIFQQPEVALVYQSYGSAAYPQDMSGFNLYTDNTNEIEAMLHMMGVNMEIIPLGNLATSDLNKYKMVVIPDAMYLTEAMHKNILNTKAKILVTGDFLRAYWDGKNNISAAEWGQSKQIEDFEIEYGKLLKGKIGISTQYALTKGLEKYAGFEYEKDRFANYKKLPADAEIFVACNETPILIRFNNNRIYHITNRIFGIARSDINPVLEQFAFQILKNVLHEADVTTNIANGPMSRTRGYVFGPYGLSNNILWNQTDSDLELVLGNGNKVIVPKNGWTLSGTLKD